MLLETTPYTRNDFLWYNKLFPIDDNAVFFKQLSTSGMNYVYDLVDPEGKIKPFKYCTERGLEHIHYLKWRGIVSCLQLPIVIDRIDENNEMCEFRFVNSTDGLDSTIIYIIQSFLYWQLIEHDHNDVIVPRIGRHCPEDIDWKSVYKRAYKIPCNTKLQEFQYKFLNDILLNNYWLSKWGLKDDDICTFCNKETEDICHVFWECMFTQHLWQKVYKYIFQTGAPVKLSIYLGFDDVKECLIIF